VSAGYAVLSATIGLFEARRIRTSGPDLITLFVVIFVLQCTLPGIVIYACLPFVDPEQPTGVPPFDRIYGAAKLP
jgi:hypothetical protein